MQVRCSNIIATAILTLNKDNFLGRVPWGQAGYFPPGTKGRKSLLKTKKKKTLGIAPPHSPDFKILHEKASNTLQKKFWPAQLGPTLQFFGVQLDKKFSRGLFDSASSQSCIISLCSYCWEDESCRKRTHFPLSLHF